MNSNKLLFLIILLSACLTQFATDVYIPSIPAIAHALNAPMSAVQHSLAIYLYGVALTLLIYGPLSDGIGRKIPMAIGLAIMLVGSLVCVGAHSIHTLILGRFLQGCGAGACAGLWRSVFRDVFTGDELAKFGSYFTIFVMFIVPGAPVIGGLLQQYLGWRASFIFMTGYTLLALVLVIFLYQETSQQHHLDKLKMSAIIHNFKRLLSSRIFMGITFSTFLTYGAMFSWLSAGPILLIHVVKVTPLVFGLLTFFAGGIAYALAGWVNGKLVLRFGMTNMMRLGWTFALIAGILMLIGKFLFGINVWAIIIPIILFYFGSTLIWPNAFAGAFTPFGDIAGYAGALYSFMQLGGGAVIGTVMAYLPAHNQIPLAWVMIICSLLAWFIYEMIPRPVLAPPKNA